MNENRVTPEINRPQPREHPIRSAMKKVSRFWERAVGIEKARQAAYQQGVQSVDVESIRRESFRKGVESVDLEPVKLENYQRGLWDGARAMSISVSHELSNSFAPVVGFTELLNDNPAVVADEQAARFAKLLFEGTKQTEEILERYKKPDQITVVQTPVGPAIQVGDRQIQGLG